MGLPVSPYELSMKPGELTIERVIPGRYYSNLLRDSDGSDEDTIGDALLYEISETVKKSYLRTFLFNLYADRELGAGALKKAIDIAITFSNRFRDEQNPYAKINSLMLAYCLYRYPDLDEPRIMSDTEYDILSNQIETLKRSRLLEDSRGRGGNRDDDRETRRGRGYSDPRDEERRSGRMESVPYNYVPGGNTSRVTNSRTEPRGSNRRSRDTEEGSTRTQPKRESVVDTSKSLAVSKWEPAKEQPYLTLVSFNSEWFTHFRQNESGELRQKVDSVNTYETLPPSEKTPVSEEAFMERSHHIAVRGGCVESPFNTDARFRTIEDSTVGLTKVKSFHLSDPERAKNEDPNIFVQVTDEVGYYEDDVNMYLDLASKMLKQKLAGGKNALKSLRAFYTQSEVVFSKAKNSLFLEKLAESSSYEQIGKKLYVFSTEAKHRHDSNPDEISTDDSLCLAERIDSYMLGRLANIINTQLQFSVVPTGNFIANNNEAARYMTQVTGDSVLADALNKAQLLEAKSLFKDIIGTPEDANVHRDFMAKKYDVEPDNVILINTPKSMTLIPFSYSELALDLKPGEVKLIEKKYTPYLWNIASSLFEQLNGIPVRPVDNYVMTTDKVQMRIYETLLVDGGFLISL